MLSKILTVRATKNNQKTTFIDIYQFINIHLTTVVTHLFRLFKKNKIRQNCQKRLPGKGIQT